MLPCWERPYGIVAIDIAAACLEIEREVKPYSDDCSWSSIRSILSRQPLCMFTGQQTDTGSECQELVSFDLTAHQNMVQHCMLGIVEVSLKTSETRCNTLH